MVPKGWRPVYKYIHSSTSGLERKIVQYNFLNEAQRS